MIVRQAQTSDAVAICEILNPIIRHSTITFTTKERTPESVAADIKARGAGFVVADDAGTVAGFASYGPFRGGPGYVRTAEHSVHVAPSGRGRGIGAALMAELEQVARQNGIHILVAGVSGSNAEGIAFHKAIGFEISGRMREVGHKDGRYLDLVLMQKCLTGSDGAPDTTQRTG